MLGIDPEIVLFGLGVGILIGLTGIGGGSLMTPLLIIVLGVHPVVAVGTDLTYGAITKTLGGYKHLRKGTVDLGVSKWLAYGGVPGALLGVLLVDRLHHAYGKELRPGADRVHRGGADDRGERRARAHAAAQPSRRARARDLSLHQTRAASRRSRWASCWE